MEKLWHNRKAQTGIALSTDGEKAWVYRCTMNVVINIYRQQQRSRRDLIPFNPARHGRSDDDSAAQMQQRLYELIDALPDEDKILMLY
jgi:DNA-directed RNA polymerase specialized sigma24 family protein